MKKLFSKLMLVALTAMTFTACEDVPNPYDVPGTGSNVPGVAEIPGGAGEGMTPEDPYNAIAAINFGNQLQQGQTSDWRFIKGKVSKIKEQFTTQYGNATFYISVDGSHGNAFYVYRVNYLANKKFATGDPELKEGDEVLINAKITNYNGTIETSQGSGFVLEHNGVNRGGAVYPSDATTDPTTPTGVNLLTNGDFESWTDGQPDHWKTTSTASNATLTQSTDAHGGSYSVSVGFKSTANQRLAHEEITLKPGTYTFSFYAKSTTKNDSQTRAGYVDVVNGTAQNYNYDKNYVSLNDTEWTLVSTTFTLSAETTVALVVMNPKNSNYATAQNILVDDATLVTADGGLADGSNPTPDPDPTPDPADVQTVTVAEFNAAAESTSVWYQLTGTISNLKDGDIYGNFDLTDETGSVYVYGVLSEKGGAKKLFQDLVAQHGITNGTTITIIGNRGSYQGKIEVMNAYFVSVGK